jgi:hypothetical protein
MANSFNSYFANIGEDFAQKINQPQDLKCSDYLYNPCKRNFKLTLIDNDQTKINNQETQTKK